MNKVQRRFVLDAMEQDYKLSEWEFNFINDIAEKDEQNPEYELTDKQNQVLNRIQSKIN